MRVDCTTTISHTSGMTYDTILFSLFSSFLFILLSIEINRPEKNYLFMLYKKELYNKNKRKGIYFQHFDVRLYQLLTVIMPTAYENCSYFNSISLIF